MSPARFTDILDNMRWVLATTLSAVVGCADDVDGAAGTGSGTGSSATGSSATGSSATSSDDSGTTEVECEVVDPLTDPTPGVLPDPTKRRTVNGANGSFTDECDANGNLVEYVCETVNECGPGPNPACNNAQTGDVVSEMFDCAGTCQDGTCVARCPSEGDEVEYIEVAGVDVVLENLTDGRRYDCVMSFDQDSDTYDCTNDPSVGDKTAVFGLGLMSAWCTGTQAFNLGTAMDGASQQCTYMCMMLP